MANRRICLDFDGVIHSYLSGWKGVKTIPDPPVEGAFGAIDNYLAAGFDVVIYSARSGQEYGIFYMKEWFRKYGRSDLAEKCIFPTHKVGCLIYIDDRGYRFEGSFPSADEISAMKPWYK